MNHVTFENGTLEVKGEFGTVKFPILRKVKKSKDFTDYAGRPVKPEHTPRGVGRVEKATAFVVIDPDHESADMLIEAWKVAKNHLTTPGRVTRLLKAQKSLHSALNPKYYKYSEDEMAQILAAVDKGNESIHEQAKVCLAGSPKEVSSTGFTYK